MINTKWYYGWNVVGATMAFQAVAFGTFIYSFAFWAAPWGEEFGVSRSLLNLPATGALILMGLLAPFAGRAMDKGAIRILLVVGATIFGLGMIAISFAAAYWQVMILYMLVIPFGAVLCGPLPAQTLAAKWFTRRRGMAIGISALGTSIGGFALPPIVTTLLAAYGWRWTFVILGVASFLIIAPMAWLILKREPDEEATLFERDAGAPIEHHEWDSKEILRAPTFWILIIAFVPMIMSFSSFQFNLGAFAIDAGIAQQDAAWLMSALALTMVGGKLFFGGFSDRVDHRYLFWIASGFMALGLLVIIQSASYAVLLMGVISLGMAAGGFLPLMGAIIGSRFGPASFGRVQGMLGPFMTLNALGPLIAGRVRDQTGDYDAAFMFFLVMLIPSIIAMAFLPKLNAPRIVTVTEEKAPAE